MGDNKAFLPLQIRRRFCLILKPFFILFFCLAGTVSRSFFVFVSDAVNFNLMKTEDIEEILKSHALGELATHDAAERIKHLSFEDIGFARVDHARSSRQGFPEVIFGLGKTADQIAGIFEKLVERSPNVLVTRTNADVYGVLRNIHADEIGRAHV